MNAQFRLCLFALALSASAYAQDTQNLIGAVDIDPIDGIVEALRSHRVVAITEGVGHGNEQGHAFVRALIGDPRITGAANDIVIEWGNSLYQDVIDRYILGEDITYDELRQVWENTTQPHTVWDRPVYQEFFEAVRSRNAVLPRDNQLRVLLGDPPMDWNSGGRQALFQFGQQRDSFPAELIQTEVIDKGRTALVIYGGMHLTKLPRKRDFEERLAFLYDTIVMRLERSGTEVFNIWAVPIDVAARFEPEVSAWQPIRLTHIRNTPLGAAGFQQYFSGVDSVPMQDQFDALLILGPLDTMTTSPVTPELCSDRAYLEMRVSRMRYESVEEFLVAECGRNLVE